MERIDNSKEEIQKSNGNKNERNMGNQIKEGIIGNAWGNKKKWETVNRFI